ncbi:hypothetical protein BN7_5583 [Wickerhamomyces ciferrii]|uniref:Uncharacterized protein n=1 Tax=Wickerhamomyces ciferrii (strain ATCC 14091 / BCRC 22168 / CBS 111 / JCM 3599 / NBRC 0793 / NRRL Y-1031 F-60-10) TaxID=1206466 RepID=K0KS57_WICCF|nr:uncharacterized protein BN7_5583 [Wickerhamomyces ciferrii]CCH45996.1 hypothetical protein BN7_5583 [Wickerhamomyces ciferrii]
MNTIEKIVKCLNLIKHFLIKKIKTCIKSFPWNIILKIKRVIRLILKIILAILWEVKKILTEILIKLYYLLRKVERWARIPIELKIYIKQEIYETLGYADEDREEYLEELFREHEEEKERENSKEFRKLKPIDEDGLSYAIGSGNKPDDLTKLFTKKFTKKELKELDRDSYNHEVIYQFGTTKTESNQYDIIPKADPLVVRSNEDEDNNEISDENWDFNITVPSEFIENIVKNMSINIDLDMNSTITTNASNLTLNSSTTFHESKGSYFLNINVWSLITVPITILIFSRLYTM